MRSDSKLQETIEYLLNDVYQGMESEVVSIKEQVNQIKTLLVDAIGSLYDAFEKIDKQSSEQMKVFSKMMSQVVDDQDINGSKQNIFQHAAQTEKILNDMLGSLINDSRKSLNALTEMDETVSTVEEVVSDTQHMARLLSKMEKAVAASADSNELKSLLADAIESNQSAHQKAAAVGKTYIQARKLINKVSATDLNKVFESKAQVEHIINTLNQSHELISDCRVEVNEVNAELRRNIGNAIRALQFEDIVSQSLGHTDLHLDRMNGFVSRLSKGISELHQKNDVGLEEYVEELTYLHQEIMAYRNGLRLEETNPITQSNMDEGDVDLF